MKALLVSAACVTVATVAVVSFRGGPGSAPSEAATPLGAAEAGIGALRENDLNRFARLALTPEQVAELENDWNAIRRESFSPDEAAQFTKQMRELTAPGAEDELYAQLLPELQELKPQIEMIAGMMVGMGQAAISTNEDLSFEERDQAQALLGAMGKVLMSDELTSDANLRAMVDVVCATARALDVATLDELAALELKGVLDKGGILLGGAKEVLVIYGLDLDQLLDSVTVEVVHEEGDAALVRIHFGFVGRDDSVDLDMVRHAGRWVFAERGASGGQ